MKGVFRVYFLVSFYPDTSKMKWKFLKAQPGQARSAELQNLPPRPHSLFNSAL